MEDLGALAEVHLDSAGVAELRAGSDRGIDSGQYERVEPFPGRGQFLPAEMGGEHGVPVQLEFPRDAGPPRHGSYVCSISPRHAGRKS
jgi:hypothetical protein